MTLALPQALPLLGVVFIGAVINGVVGLGFALVTAAGLATVLDPKSAVILLSVVAPILSLQQVLRHRAHRGVLPRIVPLFLGAIIGVAIGTQLLIRLTTPVLSLALGAFTAAYAGSALWRAPTQLGPALDRRHGPFVGVIAGVSNGALGASGPVSGTYLAAIGLRTTEFVFAVATLFVAMGLIRAGILAALGQYTVTTFTLGFGLLVPAFVGQRLGFWLQGRLATSLFERLILVVLLGTALNLLFRGAQGLLGGS